MTKQEIREILASGGLSLLFSPKDKRRDEKHEGHEAPRARGNGSQRTVEDPPRSPKSRAAG